MRRLAEGGPELAAEMRAREAGRAGHVVDADRVGVARVGEVLRSQQMAVWRDEGHGSPRVVGRDGPGAAHRRTAPSAPKLNRGPAHRGMRCLQQLELRRERLAIGICAQPVQARAFEVCRGCEAVERGGAAEHRVLRAALGRAKKDPCLRNRPIGEARDLVGHLARGSFTPVRAGTPALPARPQPAPLRRARRLRTARDTLACHCEIGGRS